MAYTELNLTHSLFHYTSVDAFKLIAESGHMRFSRADQTNDPFEVSFVRERLIEYLAAMAKETPHDATRVRWQRSLDSYKEVSNPKRFFLSCWTSRTDSIPMWRLYAREGTGLVFGLRPRAFSAFDCRLTKVTYLDGENGMLRHIAEKAAKSFGEHLDLKDDSGGLPFVVRLLEATLSAKKEQWDYENEYRLSFSFNERKYLDIKDMIDPILYDTMSKYEPTKTNSSTDPQYLFQRFGKMNGEQVDRSGAISEVILGSNCDLSVKIVEEMLKDFGYRNFLVSRSSTVWR